MVSDHQFTAFADSWWDESGPFKLLHRINHKRVEYILSSVRLYLGKDYGIYKVLDIGCGGGILTESMSRAGFENVTGIDITERSIDVASKHAQDSMLDIKYMCMDVSSCARLGLSYDVVLAMEVLEHVDDVSAFVSDLVSLVNRGGIIIISTINRTVSSFLKAIILAEYVLGLLPRNTHEFKKFLKPSELHDLFIQNGALLLAVNGMKYDVFSGECMIGDVASVNYFACYKKLLS